MRVLRLAVGLVLLPLGLAEAAVFNPATQTLANGLQVVVVENHRAPVVTHMLWIKAGAADEREGKSGVAHYLEHLMFKGTKTRPAGTYSKSIARIGGSENAFTASDYTAYFATVSREKLPLVMELEADRMQNIVFDPKEAAPELAVVLDERRQRVDSDPYAPFSQQLSAALHPHHPYGRPIIGWEPEVKALTAADAAAFHTAWYRPDNAVLVVSGDVAPAEVFAAAARYYGSWQKAGLPARQRPQDPDFSGAVTIEAADERVQERLVHLAVRAPARRQDGPRSYALEVLMEMMAGSEAAYLPRRLVQELKLASSVDVGYEPDQYDAGSVTVTAVPRDGVETAALLKALRAALADYAAQPVDEAALAAAKKSLQRSAVLARDSVMGPAYVLGMALATGQQVADVEGWPARIAAVSAADIKAALQAIQAAPQVAGIMTPKPGARSGAAAGAPPPTLSTTGPMQ